MLARSVLLVSLAATFWAAVLGCDRSAPISSPSGATADGATAQQNGDGRFPLSAGKYTVLGIMTDNQDNSIAKGNAEATLLRHPDVACLVGLWSQNTPMILAALRSSDALGEVNVVGFDEHEETLTGIREGHVHGTIVQQPYAFGYRSVEYLAAIARGSQVDVPDSQLIFVPHREIRSDNVQQFAADIRAIKAGEGPLLPPAVDPGDTSRPVRVAFITNSVDPFWTLAEFGCKQAAQQFQAQAAFQAPSSGTIEEQKRFLETNIAEGIDGLAISPIDPENQVAMINEACRAMPVICQDSDAPNTARLFYLGTSNYMAGRAAGRLIKEAAPDGGKVMLFVGRMEVLNAQERSQGIIDELSDAPIPAIFQGLGS